MSDDETRDAPSDRRRFLLGTLAALPAASLLSACGDHGSELPAHLSSALGADAGAGPTPRAKQEGVCADEAEQARRRARWRELLEVHVGGENQHELDVILGTFADDGEMLFNGNLSRGDEQLSAAHILFGFAGDVPGGLSNTQVIAEREHYTDDSILVEGRVVGDHTGVVGVFLPTFRRLTLPYCAFYRFDEDGKLASERVVMDFTPFAPTSG